jgi:hypothetical protein
MLTKSWQSTVGIANGGARDRGATADATALAGLTPT